MSNSIFYAPSNAPITGSSAATGAIIAASAIAGASRFRSGVLRLSGTWVGAVIVQASQDGTNYVTIPVRSVSASPGIPVGAMNANGFYAFNYVGQYLKVTWTRTSGTCVAGLELAPLPVEYPVGTAGVYYNGALSSTKAVVKAGAGAISSIHIHNPSNAAAYLQVFDALTADVTVGTTVPTFTIGTATLVHNNVVFPAPLEFAIGCVVAFCTTTTGSTGPSTAGVVSMGVR